MEITISWAEHRERTDSIVVPDDMSPTDITAFAAKTAGSLARESESEVIPGSVTWEAHSPSPRAITPATATATATATVGGQP